MSYRLAYPFNGIGTTAVIPQSIGYDHTEPRQGIVYRHNVCGERVQVEYAENVVMAQAAADYAYSKLCEWRGVRWPTDVPNPRFGVELIGRCLSNPKFLED